MSKFMLTAFAALAVTLAAGAAFADDSYPVGVSRPLVASAPTDPTGSEAYPIASGSNSMTTESRVVARDTGSDATPLFAGQAAISDFGEQNRIVGQQTPTG